MRPHKEIVAYVLIKCLPALVMLGMNVIYYNHLAKNEYVVFLLCMAVHLTFLQITGGWLGAAQSYYFACGLNNGPNSNLIQQAGMRTNVALWLIEFIILMTNTHSAIVALLTVLLTITQTQLQTTYIRLQLLRNVPEQFKLTGIFCVFLALFAAVLVIGKYASVTSFLFIHFAAALLPLVLRKAIFTIGQKKYVSVTIHELAPIIKYAIPMSIWFLLLATNSYFDRYILSSFYPEINPKNYLLTKELTQGVLSLLTAPFIMIAHVKIFNAFRVDNKKLAEDTIASYASTALAICLIVMPILDYMFQLVIGKFVSASYVHNHVIFLFNYIGIMAFCISMYSQKGLEVHGYTKSMLGGMLFVLLFQITVHYIFRDNSGLLKFSVINSAAGIIYLLITATLSNSIIKFRFFSSPWFFLVLTSSILYLAMQVVPTQFFMHFTSALWWSWILFFCITSFFGVSKLLKLWVFQK
ncbi:MAG: hypothetical protein ACOH2B_05835 [Burkholderiaceae bacterium]